jgi:Family of unknown function (DUF6353)
MFSSLVYHVGKLKFLLNENSSTILTAAGVAGTVSTAVLTAKSSLKAARVIDNNQPPKVLIVKEDGTKNDAFTQPTLSKTEKVKLVWALYIPPVAMGSITITSIVLAHKIDAKKIAALTAAAGISERAFQEYKDKVVEKLGPREDEKIRDQIAQDRVNKKQPTTSELVMVGDGKVLCQDGYSGRYFTSSMEEIKRAENEVNRELVNHMDCSLTELYDELGLSSTAASDSVGWNSANSLNIKVSTTITEDGRPCLVLDYDPHPFPTYSRFHDS